MKRLRALISALAAVMLLASMPALALPAPDVELTAQSAVIINLDLGEQVYALNDTEPRAVASLVKMMTALVAYDMCGGDMRGTSVTVPIDIWAYFGGNTDISVSGLVAGETMPLYDMMHGLLIPSGNEAAVAIAAHFGYSDFIDAMNAKAEQLGMTATHFVNPHGLDDDAQYSTAHDISLLALEFVANTELYEITQKVTYQLPDTPDGEQRIIYTTNLAQIQSSGFYYSPIRGIKTGYTVAAGRCFASTATRGGVRYLIVLMGSRVDAVFHETVELYRWCYSNLELKAPIDTNTVVTQVEVTGSAQKDVVVLYPDEALYGLFGSEDEIEVTYKFDLPESVAAPIAVGDRLGAAEVFYNGASAGTVGLIAREEIEKNVLVVAMEAIGAAITSTPGMIIIGALFLILLFYLYYIKIIIPRKAKRRKNRRRR